MARKLDGRQLESLSAFVGELWDLAGYETTAEWARESGYPASNLSKLRNGRGAIDGFNLLRLIEAAADRSGMTRARVAAAASPGGVHLRNGSTSPPVSLEAIAGRLEGVEGGLSALVAEVRRALEHRDVLEPPGDQPRIGREDPSS